jgi:hypothetical protein
VPFLLRLPRPSELAWQRPRRERLLLVLVAAASLSIVYPVGAQDVSRMCVTRAIPHGHLAADACLAGSLDVARYGGRLYSNKAPGIAVLAVPVASLVGLKAPQAWNHSHDFRLWAVRIATGGLALLLCSFLLGRVAEGLVPGSGGITLVAFALGTEASALAGPNFSDVQAAALCFAAFVLAWGRRPFFAGLVAGLAVLIEYEAALVAVVLTAYVLLGGWRAVARYALGAVPPALALGAYNWAAFGSPFHLSYRYEASVYTSDLATGFFGIHAPAWHSIRLVLVGDRGLLLVSPFLVAAAAGLILLWRTRHAEAAVCVVVVLAFLALDCGYFAPYGGDSPGPRYLAPALPFLALGLPAAIERRRALVAVLVAASVLASTAIALTWPAAVNAAAGYRDTVWRRLGGLLLHSRGEPLTTWAQQNLLSWFGVRPLGSFVVVFVLSLAAVAAAIAPTRRV